MFSTANFIKDGFKIIQIFNTDDMRKLEECLTEKIEEKVANFKQISGLNKFHELKINSDIEKSVINPFNRYKITGKYLFKNQQKSKCN